jgi:expansin (peptidoglycan-binding protein)
VITVSPTPGAAKPPSRRLRADRRAVEASVAAALRFGGHAGATGGAVAEQTAPTAGRGPLASYFPGYFAMVMATGIIAIGCRLVGIPVLGEVLYVVAAGA